ncbi:ABC transporter permease [Lutibacter sp. HS1-25]|uniref:ABC transporter permease n=1 Tax=Lutibacter sp. HS1-25 TaxID=2485000 RepID=UPI00101357A2|nr:ABC transporter permease [Lutibacter sp. HS1-25]RXP60888.1 ABC transporter permease [Lutibacter sp. HS1-25]
MGSIKNLFAINKPKVEENKIESTEDHREQIRITYYQSGFAASQKATGTPIVLNACLQNVYNSFENQCKKQEVEQKMLKQPFVEEMERQNTQLKKLETLKGINEEKVANFRSKIVKANEDIVNVKRNPEDYGIDVDKNPKALLYIGLSLLVPITIYLFVFYISASYSAFFKEFSDDSLTAAIFDANALTEAFKASWLEGVLIITIPFVFLGLGYLIHMMQKSKSVISIIKLVGLFMITFCFDGLLAFIIEKKIYDFNRTPTTPDFNFSIAIREPEFWMIIFAGFVVYLIWGLVFDFIMKEYDNLDKINVFIRSKKDEIKNLYTQKNKIISTIDQIKKDITDIEGKISELQAKINGFIFPIKEYLLYHSQYKEGWYQAIGTEIALPKKQKEDLLAQCEVVCQEHLKSLKLDDFQNQNVVYS